jgi:hypothetical protein
MVSYTEQVSSQIFTTNGSGKHTVVHNHWLRIAQHESKPLPQQNTPLFIITDSAKYTMDKKHLFSIAHHYSVTDSA